MSSYRRFYRGGWGNRQEVVFPICFGTYNIQNGRNRGLEYYVRGMSNTNMDLGVFQETKLTKIIYTRESSSYRVVATEAPSIHSGGVTVFYRVVEHFSIGALQTYGENIVSFQLESVDRRWFIVWFYLAPDNASTIDDVVAAIRQWPQGPALLVVGNFHTDMVIPEGWERDGGIAAAMAEEVLEGMSGRFLPHHNLWLKDGRT